MTDIILFLFTAVCSGIMDTIDFNGGGNLGKSRTPWVKSWFGITWWKNKYINKQQSLGRRKIGKTPFFVPVQVTDGWHFSKMLMVFAITALAVMPRNRFDHPILAYIILGTCWDFTFDLTRKLLLKDMYIFKFLKHPYQLAMTLILFIISSACIWQATTTYGYSAILYIIGIAILVLWSGIFLWQYQYDKKNP